MTIGPPKSLLTRRRALASLGGAAVLAGGLYGLGHAQSDGASYPTAPQPPAGADIVDLMLTAQQSSLTLANNPTPVWSYGEDGSLPIIRLKRGQWLRATLKNTLPEHTSIHWHGIRLPNAMDGVPYLTQAPVLPGESFTYAFQPPDTGTFFFHPHCNTATQLGRGLAGVLIVEGDAEQSYDADLVCAYRDWRIDAEGAFAPFFTDQGASRAGTFGGFRSVNDQAMPVLRVPANGDIRLRFLNLDMSRLIDLGLDGAEAWAIATDGNALPPVKLDTWRLGPAMRLDIAFRSPAKAGTKLRLMNYYAAEPVPMAEIEVVGAKLQRPDFIATPLKPSNIPLPAIENAQPFPLRLSAASAPSESPQDVTLPNGEVLRIADSLCLATRTFWAMNGQPWPAGGSRASLPPPLANFTPGKSYLVEVSNLTPHPHPIHLHGHTFRVLSSNKRQIIEHDADTTLVLPKERLKIALVADNPGDWMMHCHIVEHQESGMMGYFRVA